MHPGAARAAVDTLVWMDLGQEMTMERLQMFLRVVRRGGVVGAALEGALQQLQRWEGTEQPVLEAPWRCCRCVEVLGARKDCEWSETRGSDCRTAPGWNGSWVGMLRVALAKADVQVQGGLGLPPLREGDCCLVDIADAEEREFVRHGCYAAEVWRVSDVVTLDGAGIREACKPKGALETLLGRRGGGSVWGDAVRRLARRHVEGRGGLGGWYRDRVGMGRFVVWAAEGRLCVGVAAGALRGEGLEVRVLAREADGAVRAKVRKALRRGEATGKVRGLVWRNELLLMTEEVEVVRLDRLWPAEMTRVCDEAGGVEWVMADALLPGVVDAVHAQQCDIQVATVVECDPRWTREWKVAGFVPGMAIEVDLWAERVEVGGPTGRDRQALLGKYWGDLAKGERYDEEVAKAEASGGWPEIDAY